MKNEIGKFLREKVVFGRSNTIALSVPTLISVLAAISERFDIVWVTLYIFAIYLILGNSIYILTAREKLSATQIATGGAAKGFKKFPLLSKYAWIGVAFSVLLIPFFSFVPPFRYPVDVIRHGTPTPIPSATPTPTLTGTLAPTSTATATSTAIPTPTPKEQGIYYMIVLDASLKMTEAFETQSKWDAAVRAVNSILAGMEPGANYGLVVLGGSPEAGVANPCTEPASVTLPFTTREAVHARVSESQPGGGGSLYGAFVIAKNELEKLPDPAVRTLIYITGSEDNCESEDEWRDLERYFEIKGEEGLNMYSEIIIIDAENGLRTQSIAERISSISDKVNAQAPQTDFQLVQSHNEVISNVGQYVSTTIASLPTNTPTHTAPPPSVATTTRPPVIATTAIVFSPPTFTRTWTPTASPTVTPAPPTLTFTATLTPFICQLDRPGLFGGSLGGSATIFSPAHCSNNHFPGTPIDTGGGYSGIPGGSVIWVFVYPPNGPYYPQSPNACAGPISPAPSQAGGTWSVSTYLGNIGDDPKTFDIVVTVVDQAASDAIGARLYEDCTNGFYDGMEAGELAAMNVVEKAFITVGTR